MALRYFTVYGPRQRPDMAVHRLIEDLVGQKVTVEPGDAKSGDIDRTGGSAELAHKLFGWKPTQSIERSLETQVRWHRDRTGNIAVRQFAQDGC